MSGWRSVRNDPPPRPSCVLGYDLYYKRVGTCDVTKEGKIYLCEGDNYHVILWQPLPAEPTEEELKELEKREPGGDWLSWLKT